MGQFASVDLTLNDEYYEGADSSPSQEELNKNEQINQRDKNMQILEDGTIVEECPNNYIVKFEYKLEYFNILKSHCKIIRTGSDLVGYYNSGKNSETRDDYMRKTFCVEIYASHEQYEVVRQLPFITYISTIKLILTPQIQESIKRYPNPIVY